MRSIEFISIHCSDYAPVHTIREVDSWHRKRNFLMVGYHFFVNNVDRGYLELGRPLTMPSAAIAKFNRGQIAICVAGTTDFHPNQLQILYNLCRLLLDVFPHLTVNDIWGHAEFLEALGIETDKTCPNMDMDIIRYNIEQTRKENHVYNPGDLLLLNGRGK